MSKKEGVKTYNNKLKIYLEKYIIGVVFIVCLITIPLIAYGLKNNISDAIQAIFALLLLCVTTLYVIKTNDIAEFTRKQLTINETLLRANNTPLLAIKNIGGFFNSRTPSLLYSLLIKNIGNCAIVSVEVYISLSIKEYDGSNKAWIIEMEKKGIVKDNMIDIENTKGPFFSPFRSSEEDILQFNVCESTISNIIPLIQHKHGVYIDFLYRDTYNLEDKCWHISSYEYLMDYNSEKCELLSGDKPIYGQNNIVVSKLLSHRYVNNVSYEKGKEVIINNLD